MTTTRPPARRAAPVRTAARTAPARKKPAPGRQSTLQPVIVTLVLFGLALALTGAAVSGLFTVRHVAVVGKNLPSATLVAAAGVEGQNIFTVRSDEVISRLDGVREVAVRRIETSFPDTVTIYARLRVPMAAWRHGTALFLLDPQGRIIKQVASTNLPIITSTGNESALSTGVVEAVREAVQLLPPVPHGAISSFEYDPNNGLTIVGTDGWRAIIGTGSPQTTVNRVATLASFLQATKDRPQPPKLVDLRPRAPYATY